MMRRLIIGAFALALSATLQAQDHQDHAAMGHGQSAAEDAEASDEPPPKLTHDHSTMSMDKPVAAVNNPVPTSTGSIRAADAVWGAEIMQQSREELYSEHGSQNVFWLQADRLEAQYSDGEEGFLWDLQAYYGGDINKLWLKSEGEGAFGEQIEDAEVQALYSRAIAPFFDLQAGVRQDLTGPGRTHAVLGIQGLVPYEFEIDAALFLSTKGEITARIEAEYDQRITQKLALQPRAEVSLAAQDIPELGTGSGVDSLEAGLRLRYHFAPEIAPYLGIEQQWRIGNGRKIGRANGENQSATSFVVGLRFWF